MKSNTKKFIVIFLGITMIALLLIGFQARPAQAQAQIKLTYANTPPSAAFPCIQMERWAKEVEKRTVTSRILCHTMKTGYTPFDSFS
jgi:TRAP-type C4-dicarboxylate transport system substrate-binding protein